MVQALRNQKKKPSNIILDGIQHTRNHQPKTETQEPKTETKESCLDNVKKVRQTKENCLENVKKLSKQGKLKEALSILRLQDPGGIKPDFSTYASLLQACVKQKALAEGRLLDTHMTNRGFTFTHDLFLGNTLVSLYTKCGSLREARRVFEQMPRRNVVSWTVMIAAYAKQGCSDEALAMFHQMKLAGIVANQFTFASVLPACANLGFLEEGKRMHDEIIRRQLESDVFVGSALVNMYVKCGNLDKARQVFDKMPERNVVSWTTMVAGYAQNGQIEEASKLFQKMPERNVASWNAMIAGYAQRGRVDEARKLFGEMPKRDVVSWTSMIAGCAQNGNVDKALKLFEQMPEKDLVSWNTMVTGYVQNGLVDEAFKLFEKIPQRDVVSWNTMIAGYAQNGYFDEALKLFQRMQLTKVKPNAETFPSVLPACANLAALEPGKVLHLYIIKSGFESDVFVGSTLIDMYAKCSSIGDASKVFDGMSTRNVVSWNAMIAAYAIHGCGKQALDLFEQMKHFDTSPNQVTFVGVLSACCHAGLVSEGRQYFNSMSVDYHITPVMEHYCCMVDLLGRTGCLDEAHDFINKMPIEPDTAVWQSLLGACRIHANVDLGEKVAERLSNVGLPF